MTYYAFEDDLHAVPPELHLCSLWWLCLLTLPNGQMQQDKTGLIIEFPSNLVLFSGSTAEFR